MMISHHPRLAPKTTTKRGIIEVTSCELMHFFLQPCPAPYRMRLYSHHPSPIGFSVMNESLETSGSSLPSGAYR